MLSFLRPMVVVFLALSPVIAPSSLRAQEGDFDQLERVQELQREALAAARGQDWDRARELAEVVLTLDDSEYTADSRLILVQALENERHFGAALYELRQYLDLSLSPRNLRRGEQIRKRLDSLRSAELSAPSGSGRSQRQARLASAVGVLLGGIALSVTGSYLIGVDVNWKVQGVPSGSWAAIGTPMLLGGVSLDIVGLVLLRKARLPQASLADLRRFERRPRFALSWDSERLSFSVGAAW